MDRIHLEIGIANGRMMKVAECVKRFGSFEM